MSRDVKAILDQIHMWSGFALNIPLEDVAAVLDEIARVETLMPMLDPTGWMQIADTEGGHRELVEAFFAFRKVLESLTAPA